MPFVDVKFLVLAQIAIDITIIVVFILLIRKLRSPKGHPFHKGLKILESLLADADSAAEQFKEQLEEKHRLIKGLTEQLDKRIIGLNVLLNRADVMLSAHGKGAVDVHNSPLSLTTQQAEILELAKQGRNLEQIANILSIPKGEVKLVLDLKEKLSQMGREEGAS